MAAHLVILCLLFEEPPYCLPQQWCTCVPGSPYPCQHWFLLFDGGHGCEVVSRCAVDLCSLMISDVEHFVVCLLAVCVFFGERSVRSPLPFLNWAVCLALFSCRSSLPFLESDVLCAGSVTPLLSVWLDTHLCTRRPRVPQSLWCSRHGGGAVTCWRRGCRRVSRWSAAGGPGCRGHS